MADIVPELQELTNDDRTVLRVLGRSEHELYTKQIVDASRLRTEVVGIALRRLTRIQWCDRLWRGAYRYYRLTEAGRAAYATITAGTP